MCINLCSWGDSAAIDMSKVAASIVEMAQALLERLGVRLPDAFLPDLALTYCHVNRKFADQMSMAVTVHAATVA